MLRWEKWVSGARADPGFAETLQHEQLDQYSLLSGTNHHPPTLRNVLVAPLQPTGTHRKSKLVRNPLPLSEERDIVLL